MNNEQKINLFIQLQEQCEAIGRKIAEQDFQQPDSNLITEFSTLENRLLNELPDSAKNCATIKRLLSSSNTKPNTLLCTYKQLSETVSKLCSIELHTILESIPFIENTIAKRLFYFFDIAPHTCVEIYTLCFHTCQKCGLSAPMESFQYTLKLFEEQPGLFSGKKSPHPGYQYQSSVQYTFEQCPVCGGEGVPYFSSFAFRMSDFSYPDLPVKLWMHCNKCGNLYTWKYPQKTLLQSECIGYMSPDHTEYPTATQTTSGYSLSIWSNILNELKCYANGNTLLEVGVGNGELLAVALEMGYQTDAVELVTSIAKHTANVLDISVWNGDFLRYTVEKTYSIIIMGDVIEHIFNPTLALQNAYRLLSTDGVLWLSTPNFESAFSKMRKFEDPMWCEPHHITYFSYRGFAALAERCGFSIVKYNVSNRYNGSMELILKKKSNTNSTCSDCSEHKSQAPFIDISEEKGRYGRENLNIKSLEVFISSENFSEALDFIETLPLEERQQWQIQNLTGIICACCGQPKEARTFFEAALKQQPQDPEILYNLADTYITLGMDRKAKELIAQCQQYTDDKALMDDIASLRQKLAEQKGGRVLMAAYYFPPLSGSGVFRSIKFAKYLPQFGWQPTVISTDRPPNGWNFADESQLKEIPDGMEVVRIPDGISTGRETSLSNDRVQAILTFLRDVLRFSPEADRIFSQMSQSKEGIMKLLTFPCSALSWAYDVVQYIEKNIDLEQFQLVYTTSGPSSAHLIGFYLKQKYGIPWVADYRDPWTFNPYGSPYDPTHPYQKLLFELENILLHEADCNLTIEKSFVQKYTHQFQLSNDKIVSITNGYDEADFEEISRPKTRTKKFTINYSGLLYTQQRSITPILKALQQLRDEKKLDPSKVEFRIVGSAERGNVEMAKKYGLEEMIVQTGYVSHKTALEHNLNADLLLLLVGDETQFEPVYTGKFFDYLRSGRPILALAPKDGAVDRVLRETGHGAAFLSTQTSKIKEMILREYQAWQSGKSEKQLSSPAIKQFERKVLTEQLANVLENVKNNPTFQLEMSSTIYNDSYKSGGSGSNYHKHYQQSFYYSSWQLAMSYLKHVDHDASILEIACGAGQFANMLFDHGFTNYVGFDYAAESVALAKENNPNYTDKFFVADAFQTELMENRYDLVICFEVLEHIQKDLELLQRIRSGTQMLLSVPNFNDPYHVRYFSSKDEVRNRYSKVMRIADVSVSMLNQTNCLYYIWGEKL